MSAVLPNPPAKAVTPDDLLRMPDRGRGYELVDGELRERKMTFWSTFVGRRVSTLLANHAEPLGLGWVNGEGTSYRCFPDDQTRVRRADTTFHGLGRLTAAQAQLEGHCTVVPDLVVEVVSPNDLAYEVEEKREEWLAAGAQLVWLIYPEEQTIHAFRPDGTVTLFRRADTLTAEPVLPEFRVPVAELFRLPTGAG
jgi:Uma2 family endonuclease